MILKHSSWWCSFLMLPFGATGFGYYFCNFLRFVHRSPDVMFDSRVNFSIQVGSEGIPAWKDSVVCSWPCLTHDSILS
jgi:hypothetical protein